MEDKDKEPIILDIPDIGISDDISIGEASRIYHQICYIQKEFKPTGPFIINYDY